MKELPTRSGKIAVETEFVEVIIGLGLKVLDGQNMPRVHSISLSTYL